METLVDFEKSRGIVPAIAQDAATGEILMLAYMNEESFRETTRTGRACYFSRSRNRLWRRERNPATSRRSSRSASTATATPSCSR
jgi:phosphoribosyl-AMP cyclohydrolase